MYLSLFFYTLFAEFDGVRRVASETSVVCAWREEDILLFRPANLQLGGWFYMHNDQVELLCDLFSKYFICHSVTVVRVPGGRRTFCFSVKLIFGNKRLSPEFVAVITQHQNTVEASLA